MNPAASANAGNVKELQVLSVMDKAKLFEPDENGWQTLHLVARGGHVKAIRFLLDQGADVNALTIAGWSPLRIAVDRHGKDHEAVFLLQERGGEYLPHDEMDTDEL